MTLQVLSRWKDSNREFAIQTGRKKPKDPNQTFFARVFGDYKSIDSVLKKIETLDAKLAKAIKTQKKPKEAFGKLRQAFIDYKPISMRYVAILKMAIKNEQKPEGEEQTPYYRGLKLMKAELEAIYAEIDKYITHFEQELSGELDPFAKQEACLGKNILFAITECIVDIERIYANPDRDTWIYVFDHDDSNVQRLLQAIQQIVVLKEGNRINSYKNNREKNHKEWLSEYTTSGKIKRLVGLEEDRLNDHLAEFEERIHKIKDDYQ